MLLFGGLVQASLHMTTDDEIGIERSSTILVSLIVDGAQAL
jgi:hypothetical protein